jgi:hypothetical protein
VYLKVSIEAGSDHTSSSSSQARLSLSTSSGLPPFVPESKCRCVVERECRGRGRLGADIEFERVISHDLVPIETLRVAKESTSRSYSKVAKSLSRRGINQEEKMAWSILVVTHWEHSATFGCARFEKRDFSVRLSYPPPPHVRHSTAATVFIRHIKNVL